MFLKILTVLMLIITSTLQVSAQVVSIGQFSIGKSSVQLNLNDFFFTKNKEDISVDFIKDTIQWIRTENNLLTPRVLIRIKIPKTYKPIYIKYKDQVTFPVQEAQFQTSQLYINLFHPYSIQVYVGSDILDTIEIKAKSVGNSKQKQWIDHSCSPYNVEITGLNSEYSSTGCVLTRVGSIGNEKPRLEVSYSSPNLITKTQDEPPFIFVLQDNNPATTELLNKNTQETIHLKVSAKLPPKLNRLKLAYGFGPYVFTSALETSQQDPKTTLSVMLYGKYELSETSSLKAFDALIYDKTLFNNSGLYFSYDLARVYDGQIIFGALLGFQGLHYKYDADSATHFETIYPQGFEVIYNHAFGIKNTYVSYGMFLSTTQEVYRNIWLRYGQKIFYEINYIKWGNDTVKSDIEMWGLSLGIPIAL